MRLGHHYVPLSEVSSSPLRSDDLNILRGEKSCSPRSHFKRARLVQLLNGNTGIDAADFAAFHEEPAAGLLKANLALAAAKPVRCCTERSGLTDFDDPTVFAILHYPHPFILPGEPASAFYPGANRGIADGVGGRPWSIPKKRFQQ